MNIANTLVATANVVAGDRMQCWRVTGYVSLQEMDFHDIYRCSKTDNHETQKAQNTVDELP